MYKYRLGKYKFLLSNSMRVSMFDRFFFFKFSWKLQKAFKIHNWISAVLFVSTLSHYRRNCWFTINGFRETTDLVSCYKKDYWFSIIFVKENQNSWKISVNLSKSDSQSERTLTLQIHFQAQMTSKIRVQENQKKQAKISRYYPFKTI